MEMKLYQDMTKTPQERAEALLAELTVEQKAGQVLCKMFTGDREHFMDDCPYGVGEIAMASAAATPQEAADLNRRAIDAVMEKTGGIPPVMETEALCGFMGMGATSFPSGIAMAATFDPEGLQGMTDIIRKQMLSQGVRRACSPVMDVARDPRWGRCGETYGEDPTLGAAMSTAFVRGLQSDNLSQGIAATGKHFLGYAMGLAGYNSGSNHISPRELREVYAKPFQAAISEGNLQTVMNSYGAVDGVPVVGDPQILTDLLRNEMGFDGVTVSDYGAVAQLMEKGICADEKDAAVRALKAGMDVECPNPVAYPRLLEAVKSGDLPEELLDRAVRRILTVKFALGLFENPYPMTGLVEEQQKLAGEHHTYSLKMAEESIVLLKNDGILPLKSEGRALRQIAVIGPRSDSIRMMYGGYSMAAGMEMSMGSMLAEHGLGKGAAEGEYFPSSSVRRENPQVEATLRAMLGDLTPTIFEALRQRAPENCRVVFAHGCDIAGTDRSGFAEAIRLAEESDVVIYNCGGKYGWGEPCTSGEGRDTSDLRLPGVQEELLEKLCDIKTPVVVVHGDTRPINSKYAKDHAAAVLEVWTPGESGGQAVANVIYGAANPGGRLPMTAVEHVGQVPMYLSELQGDLLSLDQENVGFNSFSNGVQKPLWYFGEGLSYSTFSYSDFEMDQEVEADGVLHVSVCVTNTSDTDGDEVVQMYIRDEQASMLRPVRELAGFCRVRIPAKEKKIVTFEMRADQTAFLQADMNWIVEAGQISVMIGPTPQDIRCRGSFRITDSAAVDPAKRGFVAKSKITNMK